MSDFSIEVQDQGVSKALDSILHMTDNLTPVMKGIGRVLKSNVQLGFKLSRSPAGAPWKPLKVRKGKPLRDTGILRNSIDYSAGKTEVEIGTNVDYAPYHQFGTKSKLGNPHIPARPFLPTHELPAGWAEDVTNEVSEHLQQMIFGGAT